MKIYSLSPRDAVIQAAHAANIDIIPIGSAEHLADLSIKTDQITVDDPLDAVAVSRCLIADGVQPDDKNSLCLGLGDDSSQTAALVNTGLNLANGRYAKIDTLEKMRDKARFRQFLGADCPYNGKFWQITHPDDILDILPECPEGIIVKPIAGSGSRGVIHIKRDNDPVIANLHGPLLVEEFFKGPEYSVESISWDGVHHPLVITEKQTGGASGFVETAQLQPAQLDISAQQHLFQATQQILSRVGYNYGFSHLEFILQNGVAKIVEAHGRVGGDRIADLMTWSLGSSGFEQLFRAYQQGYLNPVAPTGTSACILFPDLSHWSDSDENWLHQIQKIPAVMAVEILRTADLRGPVLSSSDRHAQIILSGPEITQTISKINQLGA